VSALTDRAESLARYARSARFERAFERDVTAFSALLDAVPFTGPDDATPAEIDRLFQIAEEVVASVENRIESRRDSKATQLRLAESVYRIRAELEEIARWRRHFNV
jgi:hypothetical protein